MKKALLIFAGVALIATQGFAQMTGTVSGTVYDLDNNPVVNAIVHLSAEGWHGGHHGGGHGGHDDIYFDETEDDGTFFIDEVAAGEYYAMASLMGYGHDLQEITVTAGQNTEVDFVLDMDGGGHHGDSLEIVELTGYAIVEEDSMYTHYYLDIDGNDTVDFRLSFGPPWYDPESGATRPENGDSIWVVGGVMGYSEPQTVIVYEINGLFWREPGEGHGGHGGGDCPNPDSVVLVEVNGTAIVEQMPHMDMYFLDEDGDTQEDYHLNFGSPWYDPGNGASRPNNGDIIDIVGGMIEGCESLPMIIVYEINGQFWREPGDTAGLWISPTSIDDQAGQNLPKTYIAASNYPNPFNAATTIIFDLSQTERARVTIFDLLGREVEVIADREFPAGTNELAYNSSGQNQASSTIYFYKIETNTGLAIGKMILLK